MTRTAHHLPQLRPSVVEFIRLTIPAREALERAGNVVWPALAVAPSLQEIDVPLYTVEITRPPAGLVLCLIGSDQHHGLRLADEPAYPGEWPDDAVAWHERGDWTPCTCGAALLWCEAGYVPGWRICLAGHASQLSSDGRAATRMPAQDAASLAATRPGRR